MTPERERELRAFANQRPAPPYEDDWPSREQQRCLDLLAALDAARATASFGGAKEGHYERLWREEAEAGRIIRQQRDEAVAALAALREAAEAIGYLQHGENCRGASIGLGYPCRCGARADKARLDAALAATQADLDARYRARLRSETLREVAAWLVQECDAGRDAQLTANEIARRLRARADENENEHG